MHPKEDFSGSDIGVMLFTSKPVKAEVCNGNMPSYAQRSGPKLILNPNAIVSPEKFTAALRDFSRILETERYDAKNFIPPESAHEALMSAYSVLERSRVKYRERLTRNHVRQLLAGHSAEIVVAETICRMIDRFSKIRNARVPHLVEWNSDEIGTPATLHNGLKVIPVGRTNTIINGHSSVNGIPGLGEIDMIVETQTESAFFIDVSTSEETVYGKLRTLNDEKTFRKFRTRISELFRDSLGREGYRDAIKMHVVCTDEELSNRDLKEKKPISGVTISKASGRFQSERLSEELMVRLQESELLRFDKSDEGDLRSREELEPIETTS